MSAGIRPPVSTLSPRVPIPTSSAAVLPRGRLIDGKFSRTDARRPCRDLHEASSLPTRAVPEFRPTWVRVCRDQAVGIARSVAPVRLLRYDELYVILRDRTSWLALAIERPQKRRSTSALAGQATLLRYTNDGPAVPAWVNSMMRLSRRTFRCRFVIRRCASSGNKQRKRS